MASLEIKESTLTNQTKQYVYICRDPAPALAIPPSKDLANYTTKLDHIFIYNANTKSEDCFRFSGPLSLGPGSIAEVIGDSAQFVLQYSVEGDQSRYMLPLQKDSDGHKLHRDVTSEVLADDTLLDRVLEEQANGTADHIAPAMLGASAPGSEAPQAKGAVAIELQPKRVSGDLRAQVEDARGMLSFVISMIHVYTSAMLKREGKKRGKPISAIDDTALYMKVTAEAFFDAINYKQLAPVVNKTSMASAKFSQSCNGADVHPEFIKEFAKDIQEFKEDEYKKLDKILSEQVRQIENGKLSVDDSVNFTLVVKQVDYEKEKGIDEPFVVPKLRFFYISTHGKTWTEVVKNGKGQSKQRKVQLDFHYIPVVCSINKDLCKRMKKKYDEKMMNQGIDDIFTEYTV